MFRTLALILLATPLAGAAAPSASPSPAPAGAAGVAAACEHPNVPARAIHAVPPDIPAMAQQQGITGRVEVLVSLDADSKVVSTKIRSSPSALLNSSALSAARHSIYQTEIRDCKPVPSEYLFSVQFNRL